jgi:hypothetical protein
LAIWINLSSGSGFCLSLIIGAFEVKANIQDAGFYRKAANEYRGRALGHFCMTFTLTIFPSNFSFAV